jgi:metal-responsive CopG/Arc/MetJ family transcriptional regulator
LPKTRFSLLIDPELLARLRLLKARTGVSDAEQIRRAIRMWLDSNDWPARPDKRVTRSSKPDAF